MNVYVDESTGYLVIDGIEEGIDILPASLYQGYLKQIEDLTKDNKDLQAKLANMGCKLADALSAQAEANKQREANDARMHETISSMVETERMMGTIRGWICARNGWSPEFNDLIFEEFNMWYANAMDNGTIDAIDAEAKRRIAEKKHRRLQDHQDS